MWVHLQQDHLTACLEKLLAVCCSRRGDRYSDPTLCRTDHLVVQMWLESLAQGLQVLVNVVGFGILLRSIRPLNQFCRNVSIPHWSYTVPKLLDRNSKERPIRPNGSHSTRPSHGYILRTVNYTPLHRSSSMSLVSRRK